jgi:hypothetical protein
MENKKVMDELNIVPTEFTLLNLYDWLKDQEERNPKFDEYTADGSYILHHEEDDSFSEYMIIIQTEWGALLESKWTQEDLYNILDTCSFEFLEKTKVNEYSYVDELSRKWNFSIVEMS